MSDGFGKGHHLHLIDGSAFIFRAYHALPPLTLTETLLFRLIGAGFVLLSLTLAINAIAFGASRIGARYAG